MKRLIISVTVFLLFSSIGWAQSGAPGRVTVSSGAAINEPRRQPPSEMSIGQDGNLLFVELRVPSINIVDFAHKPRNYKERHEWNLALKKLRSSRRGFLPSPSANCVLTDSEVTFRPLYPDRDTELTFFMGLVFHCEQPELLTEIDFMIFSLFPKFAKIHVDIAPTRQEVLTPDRNIIRF